MLLQISKSCKSANLYKVRLFIQNLETIIDLFIKICYLQMNFKKSERSELYKTKRQKDLSFLLAIQSQNPAKHIHKFQLQQGQGQKICEIKVPLTVYFSIEKYDYTGKFITRACKKGLSHPFTPKQGEREDLNYSICISSMKRQEKAWFNIEQLQKDSTECAGYHGYHYEITIEQYVYKNDNTYESKRLIYEDNREKGKILFQKKNYKEAIKIYQKSINIMTGLSKKLYNQHEFKDLNEYAEKSEANYLKCVAKINGFGGRYDKNIGKMAKTLVQKFMKKYPNSPNSYYQKAIWLKYESRFSDAQETIKEGLTKQFNQIPEQALKEKNTLKIMIDQIKKVKQRNIRYLHREQIRKKKAQRRNNQVWDDDLSQKQDAEQNHVETKSPSIDHMEEQISQK